MKILMLASGTPHSSLTHRIVALGAQLVKAGHHVTIAAPRQDKHSNWQLDQPATINGVNFVYPFQFRSRSLILNLLPYVLDISRLVLQLKPDLIYIYKPTPLTIPGLLGHALRKTPVITDLDDLGSEVMKLEGQPGPIWHLTAWCEQLATRYANGMVVASRLLEREVLHTYPTKPVLRLSNGVNPADFTPVHTEPRSQPHVVFFGLLSRTSIMKPVLKAFALSLQQAKLSADIQLDLMGDGQVRTELEAYARELGLSDRVTFWGWTTYDQFRERARPGDIALCVMPDERTTAACSNQKIFQYQAMQLAPIVSRVGDLPLYVDNGQAGEIVTPDDPQELSQAMIALLSNAKRRHQLAQASLQLAEHSYSWENLGSQLASFIKQFV